MKVLTVRQAYKLARSLERFERRRRAALPPDTPGGWREVNRWHGLQLSIELGRHR